jgi:glycogen operon protein
MWFRHDGEEMTDEDWGNPNTQSLSMFLAGLGIVDRDERGNRIVDDNLFLILNASPVDLDWVMPALDASAGDYALLLDTNDDRAEETIAPGKSTKLVARSLKLFRSKAK